MHLRMSALPGAAKGNGSESLSQLQRTSYVTPLRVCVHSALSSLLLLTYSLWPAEPTSLFYALLSLLIILVSHATMSQT